MATARQSLIDRLKPFLGEEKATAVVSDLEQTAHDAAAEGAKKATLSAGKPIMFAALGGALVSIGLAFRAYKKRRREPAVAGLRRNRRF